MARRNAFDETRGPVPVVILVGADKGGVGKTTTSRALLDYYAAHNLLVRAFDTETPRGTLKRFHADITDVVDITTVADQMSIIDTLESSEVKISVIDIRAGLLSRTLQAFEDIGFLQAAREGQFAVHVVHVLGSSIASLEEIEEVAPFVEDLTYYVAKNFINESDFFEWDEATYNKYFKRLKNAVELTVPKLHEMAYEQVDISGLPFSEFVANKTRHGDNAGFSFVLRGYVRKWMADVSAEFDRVGLGKVVSGDGG